MKSLCLSPHREQMIPPKKRSYSKRCPNNLQINRFIKRDSTTMLCLRSIKKYDDQRRDHHSQHEHSHYDRCNLHRDRFLARAIAFSRTASAFRRGVQVLLLIGVQ